jgi:hypothetical protein
MKIMSNPLEKVTNARKIEILYRHGTIAVTGMVILSVIAAAFVYYFIWPEGKPADILLIWLVMFFLVSLMRLYGFTLYKVNKNNL